MDKDSDLSLGAAPDVLGGSQGLTWWRVEAWVLLPIPVILVAIMSLPAPRPVRRAVLRCVETLLVAKVRGPIEVLHFALLVTGVSVAFCVGPMLASEADVASLDNRRDPNVMVMLLARQYRNERNFWLSLFTLAAWTVLWVVYTVNRDKHVLRGKLLALQGQGKAAAEEVAFLGQATADGMEAAGRQAAQATGPSPATVEMVTKKDL